MQPSGRLTLGPPTSRVAIPLRGYVVCNQSGTSHIRELQVKVAIPLRGYVVCNALYEALRWAGVTQASRNPLTGLCGLQRILRIPRPTLGSLSRNPLTGLCGLQLYPPKNVVLDGTAGGGVCEKDEAWNMHRPKGGHFAGFRPMGRLRKKGQGRMHKRI